MGLFRRRQKTPTPPQAPRPESAPPTMAMPIIGGHLAAELEAELAAEPPRAEPPADRRPSL